MPFESIPAEEACAESAAPPSPDPSRQLALFRGDGGAVAVAPMARRTMPSLQDVQLHIAHLAGQIETLRRQLGEHSSDRLAMLLHEMIDERERELERWAAQEQRWDERVGALEGAIAERDAFRRREAELTRERDEARRAAEDAAQRLAAAERIAEAERRKAHSLARAADGAQAEQLRLRQERAHDETRWQSERRQLSAEVEKLKTGWIGRLIR
jgi:predicted ribosome quality control (RQC) complex YloA/Tae2 family protein